MERTVISKTDVSRALIRALAVLGPEDSSKGPLTSVPTADSYSDRLVKYIPPEVIAAFTAIEGRIGSAKSTSTHLAWLVFLVILFATPIYLIRLGHVRKPLQVGISTIAFVVWAVAYPGPPFGNCIDRLTASVTLALYVFLIPLLSV